MARQAVERLAVLARLRLAADEIDRLTGELDRILACFSELADLDREPVSPRAEEPRAPLPLREDRAEASLDREQALAEAPAVIDGCFAVPEFMDEG
jgi:aspartyl-tRNA(Asn)/glutamyl-tRNA(Gln) amidotransferase subunit C